jgi:hypothetical protein
MEAGQLRRLINASLTHAGFQIAISRLENCTGAVINPAAGKSRTPERLPSSSIDRLYENSCGKKSGNLAVRWRDLVRYEKIRAAHAKEKQRIQENVPPPESP